MEHETFVAGRVSMYVLTANLCADFVLSESWQKSNTMRAKEKTTFYIVSDALSLHLSQRSRAPLQGCFTLRSASHMKLIVDRK